MATTTVESLQIGRTVLASPQVERRKRFLGMGSRLVYAPTSSTITARVLDYDEESTEKLVDVLACHNVGELERVLGTVDGIHTVPSGNYHLELCLSDDRQFAVMQLFSFADLTLQLLSSVKTYEGRAATLISSLFTRKN